VTVPLPTPSATQILLKVHAVALNPVGYKAILHFPSFMVKKPCIPESDVAGTIVAVGEGVTKWKVGQNVYGIVPANDVFSSGQGGLAEYTLVKEEHLYVPYMSLIFDHFLLHFRLLPLSPLRGH
jgi:NADPH:quinone reductase-like Zn-dependent oxidoreductase